MLTRARSALTALTVVAFQVSAGLVLLPFAMLWARSGWCGGDGGAITDPRGCETAQSQATHVALIVLAIVLPVVLGIVTVLIRVVAGRPAGRLGWPRLAVLAALQAGACPVVAAVVGFLMDWASGSPGAGFAAGVAAYFASVTGWTALFRAAVNTRCLAPVIQPGPPGPL